MPQFCFTVSAQPLVFGTLENEAARPLPIERRARFRAGVVELDDEENAVHAETSFGVELCLEVSPSFVYNEGELPVAKARHVGLSKRDLSSSILLTGKTKRKTATCSEDGKRDGVLGVKTPELLAEVDEKRVTMVSREMETKSTKEMGTEVTKEMGTEYSKEVERKVEKEDTLGTVPAGFRPAKLKAGQEVEMQKSAMKKYYFIRDT